MKAKSLSSALTAAVLSFLLSYGGIRCLVTAFSLETPSLWLLICCGGCSLIAAALFRLRYGGAVIACVLALLGGYLWQQGQLVSQTLQLCYEITFIYDRAYGMGYLGTGTAADSIILPLAVYGGLAALLTGWCITRRRTVLPALIVCAIPLTLCLVVTDTIPSTDNLFIFMLGLVLLLMTQAVRRRNEAEGSRLSWILAGPVALGLALLFLLIPQTGYNKQDQAEKLTGLINRLPVVEISEDGELTLSFTREIPSQVNLQSIGPNTQFSLRVMEVTAEQSGRLYLRGRHYDTYTGTRWFNQVDNRESFIAPYLNSAYDFESRATGSLSIRTFGTHSVKYLPYHPSVPLYLHGGALDNLSGETKYSYQWHMLPHNLEDYVVSTIDSNNDLDFDVYWTTAHQLPQTTLEWAADYLQDSLFSKDIFYNGSVCAIANYIADLVRNSASYDLNTPRPPEDCRDFARWFLEESDTGYCVHYATATVVLLRAAGIPARYVEGYMVDTVAGETVTVTEQDAHAWAEYYVSGIGWIPLESTGAAGTPDIEAISPAQPSDALGDVTQEPQFDTIPQDTTVPSDGEEPPPSSASNVSNDQSPSVKAALYLIIVIPLTLLLQWLVRLRLREARQRIGSNNARALKKWRHVCRLSGLLGRPMPDALTELALRAKFSQHALTPTDLEEFDRFCDGAVAELRQRPWWQQLYFRLIHAAY